MIYACPLTSDGDASLRPRKRAAVDNAAVGNAWVFLFWRLFVADFYSFLILINGLCVEFYGEDFWVSAAALVERGVNASFLCFWVLGVEIDVLLEHSGNKIDISEMYEVQLQ